MGGMIAFAGALKGAGEAASNGLSNFQFGLRQHMLQESSQNFAREQMDTSYTRSRFNINDERAYTAKREQELYALGRGRKKTEASEDLDTRGDLIEKKAAVEKKEFEAGKSLRHDTALEDVTNEVTKATLLAENKAWLKAQMILANAKESSHSRALAAKTMWDLEQGQGAAQIRDTYLKLLADPHVDPATVARARQAWSAFSTKPGEEERLDASNAAAGLREAGNEIVRLQGMLKDQISGTPEYAALERRLSHAEASHDAFTERVKELTGTKDTGKSKAKVVIKDRFKGAGGTDLAMNEDPNAREAAAITQSALDKETTKKPAGMINSQRRYDFRSK